MTESPATNPHARVQIESITPGRAKRLLKRNTINRPLRPSHVAYFVSLIQRGEWVVNNDAIMVAVDGTLLNGQHRLTAIAESGRAVEMLVMRDVDPLTMRHIDDGLHRTMADLTGLDRSLVADCQLIAAIFRQAMGNNSRVMKASTEQILDIVPWWKPAHDALLEIGGVKRTAGFNNVPMRLGFGLRWAMEPLPADRDVLDQYGHMIRNEVARMTTATATLWKRLHETRSGEGGRDQRIAMASVIFYHTDPKRADVAPTIRDSRAVLHDFMTGVLRMARAHNPGQADLYDFARPEVRNVEDEFPFPGRPGTKARGGGLASAANVIPLAAKS